MIPGISKVDEPVSKTTVKFWGGVPTADVQMTAMKRRWPALDLSIPPVQMDY